MDLIALLSSCTGPTAFFAANLTWMAGIRQFESPGMSRDSPHGGGLSRAGGCHPELVEGSRAEFRRQVVWSGHSRARPGNFTTESAEAGRKILMGLKTQMIPLWTLCSLW